ncbi:hypothetical protein [Paenarthrobacter sp. NPDC018779]|uniref:hypothetical protein n=1 Tax=Paenarthrobacter sp. NPDC018779 TaxID=3364375 RepID=UPI0037C8ADC7
MKRNIQLVAVSILISIGATGCSAAGTTNETLDISEFQDVNATLDRAKSQIITPLSSYFASDEEDVLLQRANLTLIASCMKEKGFLLDIEEHISRPLGEDRQYGIWNRTNAESYGYELPADPHNPSRAAQNGTDDSAPSASTQDVEFVRHYRKCQDQLASRLLPEHVQGAIGSVDLGDTAARVASQQAGDSDEWKAIRSQWSSCLQEAGITLPSDKKTPWIPEVSNTDKASQIKTALTDIACKEKVNFIQRLADTESRYEAAYIANHEAAFEKLKTDKDADVAKAREIISGAS